MFIGHFHLRPASFNAAMDYINAIADHRPLGPIAGVAAPHFGISTPNVIIQEEMLGAVPWYGRLGVPTATTGTSPMLGARSP